MLLVVVVVVVIADWEIWETFVYFSAKYKHYLLLFYNISMPFFGLCLQWILSLPYH